MNDDFRCYLVRKVADTIEAGIEHRPLRELPAGNVLIRVACSSLNYKDAMAARGHPGVVKSFPHIPGVDAAGTVVESGAPHFKAGDEVISTGHEQGAERWGGWAEYVRLPAEWVVPLPAGLSLEEAMILGTAGFTAAQGVQMLRDNEIMPETGEVVVTGATGGVGSIAVMLLARLGYRVVAVTGKQQEHDRLKDLGATRVAGRDELSDDSNRPLLSARYAGGIDTVGGPMLATLIRSLQHRGCVANCGVVGGADLPLTVYPFILRGARISGIDSAWCPDDRRAEIWKLLAADWKLDGLERLATYCGLDDLDAEVERILQGGVAGRVVVRL